MGAGCSKGLQSIPNFVSPQSGEERKETKFPKRARRFPSFRILGTLRDRDSVWEAEDQGYPERPTFGYFQVYRVRVREL